MTSMPNSAVTDPNDALAARADERLAHAYEQIARADEQLAHITERISKLDQGDGRHPAAVASRRPSRGRPVLRGLSGLMIAACIFATAFIAQSSYGDTAKLMIAQWVPQLAPALSLPQKEAPPLAQPVSSGIQLAAAGPAPVQTAPPAQAAQQDAAPPAPPEAEQLLQSMARDLADLQQEIAQLKASQQQMASDNAKAFEDIKASQQQMAGLIALISDQNRRSATPATAAAARKPATAPAAVAHATTHPQAPVRLRSEGQ